MTFSSAFLKVQRIYVKRNKMNILDFYLPIVGFITGFIDSMEGVGAFLRANLNKKYSLCFLY